MLHRSRLSNARPQATHRPPPRATPRASALRLCVLALSAQAPARGQRGSVLQSWMLTAAAPLARGVTTVSRAISGTSSSIADNFTARSDIARLRRDLQKREEELFRLRAEVQQMRS